MTGFLLDKEQKPSAKRLGGLSLIAFGIAMSGYAIVAGATGPLSELVWPVLSTGAGLLGASVAERRK